MIVPLFLKGGNNGDGYLSAEEFRAIGAESIRAWDQGEARLRKGIGSVIRGLAGFPASRRAVDQAEDPGWECRGLRVAVIRIPQIQ